MHAQVLSALLAAGSRGLSRGDLLEALGYPRTTSGSRIKVMIASIRRTYQVPLAYARPGPSPIYRIGCDVKQLSEAEAEALFNSARRTTER